MAEPVTAVELEDRVAQAWRLTRLLIHAAEESKAVFAEAVAPLAVPIHLARALFALDEPVPMSDLADRLHCDRSYVTSLADQLEDRGWVTRIPCEDRRFKLLQLTESGRATRDQVAVAVTEDSLVLTRLGEADRALLGTLLTQLVEPTADR